MARRQLRVALYGLGPIGREIGRLAVARGHEIVVAIDRDPTLVGAPVAELLGAREAAALGVIVAPDPVEALAGVGADVAVVSTVSRIADVAPQIRACLEHGLGVVTTSEELTSPPPAAAELVASLDVLAREHGCAVVATGVNPGFVMDALPLALTAPCQSVERIRVVRVLDASARREPFRRKVGVGISAEEFERRSPELGHVGLEQSATMVARALGWTADELVTTKAPVLAADGTVAGVEQTARVLSAGREAVVLEFRAESGATDPRDEIEVTGSPSFTSVVRPGLNGDVATAAVVVNTLPRIIDAPPGFRRVPELALVTA